MVKFKVESRSRSRRKGFSVKWVNRLHLAENRLIRQPGQKKDVVWHETSTSFVCPATFRVQYNQALRSGLYLRQIEGKTSRHSAFHYCMYALISHCSHGLQNTSFLTSRSRQCIASHAWKKSSVLDKRWNEGISNFVWFGSETTEKIVGKSRFFYVERTIVLSPVLRMAKLVLEDKERKLL